MTKFFLAPGFAALALLSFPGIAAADPAPPAAMTVTRLGKVTTTFSCGADTSGTCNYTLLTSLCQDKLLPDGTKEKACNYSKPVPSFQLKPGESRTVANLPSDYLYTMKANVMPTPSECLAAPIPH